MMGRALIVAIFVLVAGAVGGCGITDVGKPLSIDFNVDRPTASVGDSITFEVVGTGQLLSAIVIEFGEEDADDHQFDATGQSATTSTRHAYESPGTYQAVGIVFDSSGQLSDTIDVVIDEG